MRFCLLGVAVTKATFKGQAPQHGKSETQPRICAHNPVRFGPTHQCIPNQVLALLVLYCLAHEPQP